MNIDDFLKSWLLSLKIETSHNTLLAYQNDLKQFFSFFKDIDILKIDLQALRSWLSDRYDKNYSKRSTNRAISSICSFFRFLKEKKLISDHSIFHINRIKIDQILPRSLSIDDIYVIFEQIEKKIKKNEWTAVRDFALFKLLYGTGLRISEALSLNHGDIASYLSIKGKGGYVRVIPLSDTIKKTLCLYKDVLPFHQDNSSPLFYGTRGKRLSAIVAARQIQKLRPDTGLPEYITPHSFRHTCATHILDQGGNLRYIQKLLGHKSLNTSQIYLKVSQNKLIEEYINIHPRKKT